jgi:hypothetical protein
MKDTHIHVTSYYLSYGALHELAPSFIYLQKKEAGTPVKEDIYTLLAIKKTSYIIHTYCYCYWYVII